MSNCLSNTYIVNRCLGKKLCGIEIIDKLKKIENMEKYIAQKNNKLQRHNKKWLRHDDPQRALQQPENYIMDYIENM